MGGGLFSLALGFAVVFGLQWCWRGESWTKTGVKTASTALLALAAPFLGAPWPVTAGLALGAAGDFALSRPGERAFLAGMAAFAAGHLAYAWVFLMSGVGDVVLVPALLVVAVALSTEWWLAPRTGALRWPVRGYVLVIAAMMLAALTLPDHAVMVIAGAALFMLSDLLLAVEMFVRKTPSRALSRAVWACYWGGQALICLGAAALAATPGGAPL